jgi:hypothetical protein
MAKWAQGWQARLGKGVSHAEVLAEMRRPPAPSAAFHEWTVAGEDLMKTVEYNAGIENTRRYLENMRLSNPVSETNQFVMPSKK